MLQVDYSELFKNAHAEARKIVAEVGDYMIAFKIALTDQWKKAKTIKLNDDQIAKLEKDGWSRWTVKNYDRLYFNSNKNGILDIETYKTGNICYSAWNGEEISHAEAYRILNLKCYVDVADARVTIRSYGSADDDEIDMLKSAATKSFEKAIA